MENETKIDLSNLGKLTKDIIIRTLISKDTWNNIKKHKEFLLIKEVASTENDVIVDITLVKVDEKKILYNILGYAIAFQET